MAEQVRCPGCGRLQDRSADRSWCLGCARPLPGHEGAIEALNELIAAGPSQEASRAVIDVLEIEKRSLSLAALVPVYGLLAIRRSEVHTPLQKLILGTVSLAVTLATAWALWVLFPGGADEAAPTHARIGEQMAVLGELANREHQEKGAYPTAEAWRRNAEHADGRFFDPWGRPYLYEADRDRAAIKTLGRDAARGGAGLDADLSLDIVPRLSPLGSAAR